MKSINLKIMFSAIILIFSSTTFSKNICETSFYSNESVAISRAIKKLNSHLNSWHRNYKDVRGFRLTSKHPRSNMVKACINVKEKSHDEKYKQNINYFDGQPRIACNDSLHSNFTTAEGALRDAEYKLERSLRNNRYNDVLTNMDALAYSFAPTKFGAKACAVVDSY